MKFHQTRVKNNFKIFNETFNYRGNGKNSERREERDKRKGERGETSPSNIDKQGKRRNVEN